MKLKIIIIIKKRERKKKNECYEEITKFQICATGFFCVRASSRLSSKAHIVHLSYSFGTILKWTWRYKEKKKYYRVCGVM